MVALVCDKHRTTYPPSGTCLACASEYDDVFNAMKEMDKKISEVLGMSSPIQAQISPDELVRQVKREADSEFRDILWQVVQQRMADAMEGLARLSQPEVGEKREMTTEQMVREYMLDIAVGREAARMLQDIMERK